MAYHHPSSEHSPLTATSYHQPSYEPPFLPSDDDDDESEPSSPPPFFTQPPLPEHQIHITDFQQQPTFASQQTFTYTNGNANININPNPNNNFIPSYEPPPLQFSDPDSDSDGGEAPASIRFEMAPLNGGPRSPGRRPNDFPMNTTTNRRRKGRKFGVTNLGRSIIDLFFGKGDKKDEAMKIWRDAENLDKALERIYEFYTGKGFWAVLLAKWSNLVIFAFIVWFTTFLSACVDYGLIPEKTHLGEVLKPNCIRNIHGIAQLLLLLFTTWWTYHLLRLLTSIPTLLQTSHFYTHILEIPDNQIQHLPWSHVTQKLSQLPPPSSRNTINAHTIASRLMRKENYLIALFDDPPDGDGKEIFGFGIPVVGEIGLTKVLEWNLRSCVEGVFFGEEGRVRRRVLRGGSIERGGLVTAFRNRLRTMAILNLLLTPFILTFLLLYFFFRYTEEFYKNPSTLSLRTYTPLSHYKFREYNELPHLFHRRLMRSHKVAEKYMEQFPDQVLGIIARFATFITSSLLSTLILLPLLSPTGETLLHTFHLPFFSHQITLLFTITMLTTATALLRSLIPSQTPPAPSAYLHQLATETRYWKHEWKGHEWSPTIRKQWDRYFTLGVLIALREIIGVLGGNFWVLRGWSRDTHVAERVVNLFCEGTGVERGVGMGFIGRNRDTPTTTPIPNINKMTRSLLSFRLHHPDWTPADHHHHPSFDLDSIVGRKLDSVYAHPTIGGSLMMGSLMMMNNGLGFGNGNGGGAGSLFLARSRLHHQHQQGDLNIHSSPRQGHQHHHHHQRGGGGGGGGGGDYTKLIDSILQTSDITPTSDSHSDQVANILFRILEGVGPAGVVY